MCEEFHNPQLQVPYLRGLLLGTLQSHRPCQYELADSLQERGEQEKNILEESSLDSSHNFASASCKQRKTMALIMINHACLDDVPLEMLKESPLNCSMVGSFSMCGCSFSVFPSSLQEVRSFTC